MNWDGLTVEPALAVALAQFAAGDAPAAVRTGGRLRLAHLPTNQKPPKTLRVRTHKDDGSTHHLRSKSGPSVEETGVAGVATTAAATQSDADAAAAAAAVATSATAAVVQVVVDVVVVPVVVSVVVSVVVVVGRRFERRRQRHVDLLVVARQRRVRQQRRRDPRNGAAWNGVEVRVQPRHPRQRRQGCPSQAKSKKRNDQSIAKQTNKPTNQSTNQRCPSTDTAVVVVGDPIVAMATFHWLTPFSSVSQVLYSISIDFYGVELNST